MHARGTDEGRPPPAGETSCSITATETMIFENEQHPSMHDMGRVEIGAEGEDLSMLSTNNMGFHQLDSFESDLLLAFANGDAHFGLPDIRTGSTDKIRRTGM